MGDNSLYFSSNIKLLRKRKGRTQEEMAFSLNMKRPTLGGYENGVAQPGMETLILFSDYFNIAVDTLLRVDLTSLSESSLYALENGLNSYIKGGNLRVLATTVDKTEKENIELVSEKAQAGYAKSFGDPQYIKELPSFQLPFLSPNKKYRMFQISGDSMLPIPDKSYITTEFVHDWNSIKSNEMYVIVTREDGVLFKEVKNELEVSQQLLLISKNKNYQPYYLHASKVQEVWKFIHYITSSLPESTLQNEEIDKNLAILQAEVAKIKMTLNL